MRIKSWLVDMTHVMPLFYFSLTRNQTTLKCECELDKEEEEEALKMHYCWCRYQQEHNMTHNPFTSVCSEFVYIYHTYASRKHVDSPWALNHDHKWAFLPLVLSDQHLPRRGGTRIHLKILVFIVSYHSCSDTGTPLATNSSRSYIMQQRMNISFPHKPLLGSWVFSSHHPPNAWMRGRWMTLLSNTPMT